jgi:hypothetical protein
MVAFPRTQSVELEFYHPEGTQVYVMVDNDSPGARRSRMLPGPGGSWRCRLNLPEGEHGFRFLADGKSFSGASIRLPATPGTIHLGCNAVHVNG